MPAIYAIAEFFTLTDPPTWRSKGPIRWRCDFCQEEFLIDLYPGDEVEVWCPECCSFLGREKGWWKQEEVTEM